MTQIIPIRRSVPLRELMCGKHERPVTPREKLIGDAVKAVAARQKIALPAEVSITSEVSIGAMTGKPGAFGIAVAMVVSVPGMDKTAAEALVKAAHEVCPYSNATRGNIDVALSVA